jgi:hypothetical protein
MLRKVSAHGSQLIGNDRVRRCHREPYFAASSLGAFMTTRNFHPTATWQSHLVPGLDRVEEELLGQVTEKAHFSGCVLLRSACVVGGPNRFHG